MQNKSMNFIYKNLFALPNLKPNTKHKKRIIPAIITGRISSFFLLLYYTPNSLCWLDGGPPYKNVVSKVGGLPKSWGSGPPDSQWLRPCEWHTQDPRQAVVDSDKNTCWQCNTGLFNKRVNRLKCDGSHFQGQFKGGIRKSQAPVFKRLTLR